MPELVERSDPEGVDYGWVMQVTFVVTIAVGAPIVAVLSTVVSLPTWGARVAFAVRVGAVVWFLTAVGVYVYARQIQEEDAATAAETESAATAAKADETAVPAEDAPESDGTDDADGEPTVRSDATTTD